jgi:type I restriction enzyme S subunit
MKKYDSYKDSYIDWIGEIPEHWEVSSIKFLSKIQNGSTPSSSIDEYWNGDVNWVTTDDLGKLKRKEINKTKRTITQLGYESCGTTLAPIGSIVLSTRAPIGHIGILKIEACSNQGCKTIIPANVNSSFCYYYFLKSKNILESLGQGSTFKELPTSTLKDFKIVFPSIDEQTQIANYLDHKTTQIDTLISKKQQFITLLQEERIAVINQAVTKGLDPKVKMKDSGIEWLGEIPEHWEVKKLKLLANIQGRIGFKGYTVGDLVSKGEGALTLGAKHIDKNNQLNLSNPEFISWDKYYESPEIMVQIGDIILTQRCTLGKVILVTEDIGKATINPSIVILSKLKANDFFLYYFFNSDYFKSWIDLTNTATAVPMISQGQLGNLKLVLPNIDEQNQIVNSIQKSIKKIDDIIVKALHEIELLKEYKTALISEVVTGKVDVRDVVIN